MTWLFAVEEMRETEIGISGVKYSLLKFLHLTIMMSTHRGDHLSAGFGVGPFEVSVQLSMWYNKEDKE